MTRRIFCLDGQWEFYPDPERRLTADVLGASARTIVVPGPWQAQFDDLREYSGIAWYRRTFEASDLVAGDGSPPEPTTRLLRFGAVDYIASVWLNGHLLGEHEGGYLPFELPIDQALRDGTNELVVRVIDPDDDLEQFPEYPFAEIPHGKQSWYGPISGIWQSVSLELRHAVHIVRLHVTPDVSAERALVTLRLNRPIFDRYPLLLSLTHPDGQTTQQRFHLDSGTNETTLVLNIPSPLLWDTRNPHLYHLTVALHDGQQQLLDICDATFGMRTVATSPDGYLMLNGRVLYLRGALDQDYYPKQIYTPFSDAELEDQFAKAKHMGLNCLRTHIKITDPRYYDAADRAGLLIWTELPNWERLTTGARRRARETLAGMVERDWNHPSIIIWTIINEGWGVDLAVNADHRSWLLETYSYLKELDPYRLVVGNSPCFSNFHVVTDIEDFHNYYAIPDHYRQWRDWVQVFATRPPWTFAHSYERYDAWREFMRDPWNPLPRTAAPEVRRRGNEPMVVSEFGNWGLPDVQKLKQCYGGEPWWFETGLDWGDGVTYPHGVEQRFQTFYLDKVFGNLSNLAAASQRMQFTALKYQIEQMRRYQNIVGYIITEFTDVHWEANGLLDICRNPKAYYDVIGNVNSADAIVPDYERVVFWEGERCEIRLAFSHFSELDIQGCTLRWQLDQWPQVAGSFSDITALPGQVSTIGTVVLEVPAPERSARVRLELELYDAQDELITRNHLELFVFARKLERPALGPNGPLMLYAPNELGERLSAISYQVTNRLEDADLVVVETMTDEVRWYLEQGGTVLWLAEKANAQQTYLGSIHIAQRTGRSWQGDWASSMSWIRQDRLFGDIPTGGMVDFAFADLTPEQVIVGLRPKDFARDVFSGLFVGWIHHIVALIAERRFGNGTLLISTFQISEQISINPVARILMHDLLTHLARVMASGTVRAS